MAALPLPLALPCEQGIDR